MQKHIMKNCIGKILGGGLINTGVLIIKKKDGDDRLFFTMGILIRQTTVFIYKALILHFPSYI